MSNLETGARRARTAAERKRDQRLRQVVDPAEGKPPLTAETMQMALMEAMSLMLRDRHFEDHVEAVIFQAGSMLWDSKRARAEMRRRLQRRLPKIYKVPVILAQRANCQHWDGEIRS
ncbi:hypothetical protein [Dongia sp.]|uniref:hypothetical protein n=1 Tax=Dongia sp. TaxID=1977262 RepID=UPI0035B003ED